MSKDSTILPNFSKLIDLLSDKRYILVDAYTTYRSHHFKFKAFYKYDEEDSDYKSIEIPRFKLEFNTSVLEMLVEGPVKL